MDQKRPRTRGGISDAFDQGVKKARADKAKADARSGGAGPSTRPPVPVEEAEAEMNDAVMEAMYREEKALEAIEEDEVDRAIAQGDADASVHAVKKNWQRALQEIANTYGTNPVRRKELPDSIVGDDHGCIDTLCKKGHMEVVSKGVYRVTPGGMALVATLPV